MNHKLSNTSRIIAIVCAICLLFVLSGPIWQIELAAPQYPEGLELKIHAHKLAGDVDVINGLNHYIGMRTLHTKDFIEFAVLPYIIATLAVFGFLTALVNRKWFLITWSGCIVLFGIISMVDFYRWNYNYGHNLDPSAPIQVPGQSYQPPLIGYKQLLNFGAYSIPDIGGWLFITVGVLIAAVLYLEFREYKKIKLTVANKSTALVITTMFFMGCSTGPQPITAGKEDCTTCKMTIMDTRFASELVTEKGKVFKFDDLHCLSAFMNSDALASKTGNKIYLVEYNSGNFIEPDKGKFLKSESFHTPMGSNIAVFNSESSLKQYKEQSGGEIIFWEDIIK